MTIRKIIITGAISISVKDVTSDSVVVRDAYVQFSRFQVPEVGSRCYVTHMRSRTRHSTFLRATLKTWEWPGNEVNYMYVHKRLYAY